MSNTTKAEIAEQRLLEVIEQARAATAELNGTKKDLERTIKEAREVLKAEVATTVSNEIERCLNEFGEQIRNWSDSLYGHVQGQVDLLINLAIGKPGKEEDLRPLMAAMFRRWIGEQLATNKVPAMVILGDLPIDVAENGGPLETDLCIPEGLPVAPTVINDAIRRARS